MGLALSRCFRPAGMQATEDRSGTRFMESSSSSSPLLSPSFLIPLSGRQSLPLRSPPVCTRLVIKPARMPVLRRVSPLLSSHDRGTDRNVWNATREKFFNARGNASASHEPVTRETKSMNRIVDNYRARPFAEGQKPLLFDPGHRILFQSKIQRRRFGRLAWSIRRWIDGWIDRSGIGAPRCSFRIRVFAAEDRSF